MTLNPMCCGSHCRSATGLVRVYPLGGGANLVLCKGCWDWENKYRLGRGYETGNRGAFPTVNWEAAEVYGGEESK